MKRSRLKRSDPEDIRAWRRRTASRLKRSRLNPFGKKRKRDRSTGRTFGPLSDLARQKGCQIASYAPTRCRGDVVAAHARARGHGGGRGDWRRLPDGTVVGNVLGACVGCHAWADGHKAESQEIMDRIARENGEEAIERGIEPVL